MTAGDVMIVILSTLIAIMSLGSLSPNLKTFQEACAASSNYFTLVEREQLLIQLEKIINLLEMKFKEKLNLKILLLYTLLIFIKEKF